MHQLDYWGGGGGYCVWVTRGTVLMNAARVDGSLCD